MQHNQRLSAYRTMWLFVFFDLPTHTGGLRHKYTAFRNALQRAGFQMHQYSVYIRHCPSHEAADEKTRHVTGLAPDEGLVSILRVTDKQYGNIINLFGRVHTKLTQAPKQLEIF